MCDGGNRRPSQGHMVPKTVTRYVLQPTALLPTNATTLERHGSQVVASVNV